MSTTMQNTYNQSITFKNVMKFAVPIIFMSLFTTFYTMVDGLFVSNLIGTQALSAINLTAPIIGLIVALSGMLATGGSALVMRKFGEGKIQEAKEDFTLLILTNVVVGLIMMVLGSFLMDSMFATMNLSDAVIVYCKDYLSKYLIFTIPILLMYNFSIYMIAADKSRLSLLCSIAGGLTNIVLDYLLIAVFDLGITGAALATGMGYSITAISGLIVFSNKTHLLHFTKPVLRMKVLAQATINGSSEMATTLVTGVTTLLFNYAMLKYVGEDGVAAITIIMYVLMFAGSLFTGYAYGVAPLISYHHGADNTQKLRKLIQINIRFVTCVSVIGCMLSLYFTETLVGVFTSPSNPVYALAVTGNRICSIGLLFLGLNTLTSGMFTALSNGLVSAVLAFTRTFVFTVTCILLLPALLGGVTGVWLATPVAEVLGLSLSIIYFFKYKKKYNY